MRELEKQKMTCPVCQSEIFFEDDKFMLGIERPYMNIWFHKDCFNPNRSDYVEYILSNADYIIECGNIQQNANIAHKNQ